MKCLQGAIYRIMFFHVPAGISFMLCSFVAMVASVMYLARKSFAADSVAVSVTEIALLFGAMNLATGMVWARIIWGVWWAWDARLTFMLISMLMYGGYMMLRQVIEEPVHRARISAVLSILTFPAVVITYKAIDWWRTQHPGPVLSIRTGGGRMDPAMESVLYLNLLAVLLFASRAGADPYPAGRNASRTRWAAQGGACDLDGRTKFHVHVLWFRGRLGGCDSLCAYLGGARTQIERGDEAPPTYDR